MKFKLKCLLFLWWNILIAGGWEHEETENEVYRIRRESAYKRNLRLQKTKKAADKYDGPIYKPSDWKTGRADEIVWGVAYYNKTLKYKEDPDKAPTVCFNPLELRNGTHAYFICPEEGEDVTHTECCGPDYGQNCCKNYTKSEGINLLFLIPCVLAICGGLAYCEKFCGE